MFNKIIKLLLFSLIIIGLFSVAFAEDEPTEWEYSYTGGVQEFIVPYSEIFQLETWGASGGYSVGGNNGGGGSQVVLTQGGKGGYAKGSVYLKKDQRLYICVGGQGSDASRSGRKCCWRL